MSLLFEFNDYGELTQSEAEELLRPVSARLCECWFAGWDEWRSGVDAETRAKLSSRSRATVLNDLAIDNAKRLLAGESDIEPNEDLGFFKLYFGDRAVLRFKRLDANRLARNLRTDQQIAYYSDLPILGLRPGTRLTVGYMLNAEETALADVLITRQLGRDRLIWSFSILDDADIRGVPLAPTPLTAPSVRIRPAAKRKAKEGGSA